jgi:hypothetical protein
MAWKRMRVGVIVTLLIAMGLAVRVDAASGQGPREDRGRREEGRDRDGRSRGPGGDSDRFESFLRALDANGDGVIAPEEVEGRRRGFFEGYARRVGLDPSRPIPLAAVRESAQRSSPTPSGPDSQGFRPAGPPMFGQGQAPGPPGGGMMGGPSDAPSSPKPMVLAFSVQGGPPAVAGFGSATGPSLTPSAGASPSGSSGSHSGSSTVDARVRQYAESLVRQYDKNKNGTLEREEWSELRGRARESDANGDGVITVEELVAALGGSSRSRGGPSAPASSPSASSSPSPTPASAGPGPGGQASTSSSAVADQRRPYRALLPHERLPEGLPEWFVRKDANQDGQVTMAEYATEWTDARAAEFAAHDLNHDGIITPAEALTSKR